MNTTPGELQTVITRAMGLTHKRMEREASSLYDLCGAVSTLARARAIPYDCYTAAYGIQYAIQTGRIDGATASRLNALKGNEATALISIVAVNCGTIADVPAFLIKHNDFITGL